mgnify:CR=1 FL=1
MKFAIDNDMIDMSFVQEQIEMKKREEILKKHPYKIWKGKDGNWYTYLPNKEKGRVLKKKTIKKDLEDDIIEYWEDELEDPTITDVFEEWNNRRLELKKISEATHLRNCQVFNRHYEEFGKYRIKSIDENQIVEFLEEQIAYHNLTAKAFSNLKTITRGFLKRAKKRKLVMFNVEEIFNDIDISEIKFKKVIKEDYEEVFNEEEMPIIIDYLKNNPDLTNLGIMLMFVTGIRVGEVVGLKHDDFEGNTFKIRRTETRFKNENGEYVRLIKEFPKSQAGVRTAIIPKDYEWLTKSLRLQNPFDEYIFVKDGSRISTQAVRARLWRICKKLGIYNKSPHKIRKTYGSILLDNHIDNRLIIEQMGHTDILCTEEHYHRNRKSIDVKAQLISSIPEFQNVAK